MNWSKWVIVAVCIGLSVGSALHGFGLIYDRPWLAVAEFALMGVWAYVAALKISRSK